MKIELDKYYTPEHVAEFCVNRVLDVIGAENISEFVEPSAGNGVFLKYLDGITDKNVISLDIEPDNDFIVRQDFLKTNFQYLKGRCVIGNPPYGLRMSMAQKFYRKSVQICDYIAFILPISQLNNTHSLYEFDLIDSYDLGIKSYSDRELHCCFNIYKRPESGINSRCNSKCDDITICRQDSNSYESFDYDIRMCYWGDGTAGKILSDDEHYSAEYKIKINNIKLKEQIIECLKTFDWSEYLNCIAMRKIQQFHIIEVLKKSVPEFGNYNNSNKKRLF